MWDLNRLILCGVMGILALAAGAEAQRGAGRGKGQAGGTGCGLSCSAAELTVAERATLLHMYEEEKAARDFYGAMFAKWDLQSFANIQNSEVRHFTQLEAALSRRGIDASAITNSPAGVFTTPEIQALYDQLIGRGVSSLIGALNAAGYLEEVDIADLRSAIAGTSAADLDKIYANLLGGSENHLRAAARQLALNGEGYAAQYLPAVDVAEILSASNPSGRGRGRARNGNRRR